MPETLEAKTQTKVNVCTQRSLGINPRSLGISPKQLSSLRDDEVADKLRSAARRLFVIARRLEVRS